MFTTIQDLGRFGSRSVGVPQSGAMDDYAARLANILVGNEITVPLLEISYTGPKLHFHSSAFIAITGADLSPQVNGENIRMNQTVCLHPGDKLSFGGMKNGCRAYLAIRGGLLSDYVMESCSTYVPAGFGGHHGRPLIKGDLLFYHKKNEPPLLMTLPESYWPNYDANRAIRILEGPEWNVLDAEMKQNFSRNTFKIGHNSDRMGIRLEGKLSSKYHPVQMLSSPLGRGSIQLIPSGEMIIVMNDGQTTGGYPRIASIIAVDLGPVAQLKPGDEIKFKLIDQDQAKSLFLHREAKLEYLKGKIFPKGPELLE